MASRDTPPLVTISVVPFVERPTSLPVLEGGLLTLEPNTPGSVLLKELVVWQVKPTPSTPIASTFVPPNNCLLPKIDPYEELDIAGLQVDLMDPRAAAVFVSKKDEGRLYLDFIFGGQEKNCLFIYFFGHLLDLLYCFLFRDVTDLLYLLFTILNFD
ncbi:hypothetical protein LIER_19626 [Lithospermum erythrorhizon]|uniref:Uncharacterized protein n=1 Tax=Lithospermum erythrorhizon TaxID=34254 RepID=A0AAV3QIG4_LITER